MPESFIKLPLKEQAEIITALAPTLGRIPAILEKDIWVCWTLQQLFSMPNALAMVFKGGTSLSKAFDAIQRFSEDVDITIDYRLFDNTDPFAENSSKTSQKKLSARLKKQLCDYVQTIVKPYFQQRLKEEVGYNAEIKISDDGEKCWIDYPTALASKNYYIHDSVLLEFGARNSIEPHSQHIIKPYIADALTAVEFPQAMVNVLSPLRTFWEKATLIHVECHRSQLKKNADRLSRHWYDLAMLSQQTIGKNAIRNIALLVDVIKYKKVFFDANYAHYELCLQGKMKLLPNKEQLFVLRQDYQQMTLSGMFFITPPSFDEIINQIKQAEEIINIAILKSINHKILAV